MKFNILNFIIYFWILDLMFFRIHSIAYYHALIFYFPVTQYQLISDQESRFKFKSRGEKSGWSYEKKSIQFASDYSTDINKVYGTGTPEQARPDIPRSRIDFPNQYTLLCTRDQSCLWDYHINLTEKKCQWVWAVLSWNLPKKLWFKILAKSPSLA